MRFSLACVVLAVLAAFPSAAGATWPGKPGPIVYSALDDDDEGARDGIYAIGPDGSRNRRIARRATGDVASSRDGKQIAFFRSGSELWQARSDGSRARRVLRLQDGSGSDPAWSPSGRQLVFTLTVGRLVGDNEEVIEMQEVWVVRRGGGGLRMLHRGHAATWSSRGLIAFAEEDGLVATIRPNGRGRRVRVRQRRAAVVTELDFSPNGRRLVYLQSTRRLTKSAIHTVNLRTGGHTSFRDSTRQVSARDVAWAPSSDRLAYAHRGPGNGPSQLRTIRPNGTGIRTLFDFPSGLTPFGFAWPTRRP